MWNKLKYKWIKYTITTFIFIQSAQQNVKNIIIRVYHACKIIHTLFPARIFHSFLSFNYRDYIRQSLHIQSFSFIAQISPLCLPLLKRCIHTGSISLYFRFSRYFWDDNSIYDFCGLYSFVFPNNRVRCNIHQAQTCALLISEISVNNNILALLKHYNQWSLR